MKIAPFLKAFPLLAVIVPHIAHAEPLPPYQPLEIRHVCARQAVHASPAGTEQRILEAGERLRLRDVTFAADGTAWFALDYSTGRGLETATGYLPTAAVKNFCADPVSPPVESQARLQSYAAPPNTCHLVVNRADTLGALNDFARSMPRLTASMSGYREATGGYALTVGLLSSSVNNMVVTRSDRLPAGSSCVSGTQFTEALSFDGTGFAQPADGGYSNGGDRLAAAQELLTRARDGQDPDGLKQSCDLGLGAACTEFAHVIYGGPDGPDRGPLVLTRYALLGCMAGDLYGCQMAVNRQGNTLEFARSEALPSSGDIYSQVTTEIAKSLCDAKDKVGCILLARATAISGSPSLVEAASNFAANLIACQEGIAWICDELRSGFDLVANARGGTMSDDERFAIAGIETGLCTMGAIGPEQRGCTDAYYGYRDFLRYGTIDSRDEKRVAVAVSVLSRGCTAGDPPACLTLATMPEYWSVTERRNATSRVIAQCEAQVSKTSICESLDANLDPTLPETRPLLRMRYERLAQACRTPGNGSYQDCIMALRSYAALDEDDRLGTVERMLNDACSPSNINGCTALALLYGELGHESGGIKIPGRNDPEAYIRVLSMGCMSGTSQEPGNTCLQLSEAVAADGRTETALQVLAESCEASMERATQREDARDCYEASKMALAQNARLDDALRWASFVCEADDISFSPYACKLTGNVYATGLGRPADPLTALIAYGHGCFHPRVRTTDGESCLKYGNMLVAAVRQGEMPAKSFLPSRREEGEEQTPQMLLAEASRAYDMGCMDGVAQACDANANLLEERSTGDLPYDRIKCQVRSGAGKVTSEKTCRAFDFYQAEGEAKAKRRQVGLNVYVWPDGDRSVTYRQDGLWRLNETTTEEPVQDGATRCWRNPVTTRSFCVTPAG